MIGPSTVNQKRSLGYRGIRGMGIRIAALALAGMLLACAAAEAASDGWITDPQAAAQSGPVTLHFRRVLTLDSKPAALPVTVTADNRYILYVNGRRVAAGPSEGTLAQWRTQTIDIAPYLTGGRNVVAAVVWDWIRARTNIEDLPVAHTLGPQTAPIAWQSAALGFRMTGGGIDTAEGGWRVSIDASHTPQNGRAQIPNKRYYVASAPEVIDAAKADPDWAGPQETGTGWRDAVSAPDAARRTLTADRLPQQSYAPADPGKVVRSDLAGAENFPAAPVTVPANSHVHVLMQRPAMISAYPRLSVSGGAGATIRLTYAEALYDKDGHKGDRDLIGDRHIEGFHDTYLPDGGKDTFAPLWWRTWRYAELDIETGAAPLTLEGFQIFETSYPFEKIGHFHSSDPALDRVFEVGWRTALVDAHETYMDSSYWEQLQYTGDTRLQMLISYAVGGDPRLARQAIDAFAESVSDGGLQQGAYPSRSTNVIATFSLAWVGMLHDWSMQQPDTSVITGHLPRMRTVLDWFVPWLQPDGLLGKNPQWNFIDWVNSGDDRKLFPSFGKDGGSCLTTVLWLGALRQGAALEAAYGDKAQAAADTRRADAARAAIRAHCWDRNTQLFADNADFTLYSQHMNLLAVLYDVATPQEAPGILERVTVPGHGIDAPPGMFTTTYYFAWYLVRAFEHAGLRERYPALLKTWRDLLDLHYTTWPESRQNTRSDTHAWSAHPTADMLNIIAGIGPDAPGYARLRVAPVLGDLTSLDAAAATPSGRVSVRYTVKDGQLEAQIDRPDALPGDFIWKGKRYPLTQAHSRFTLPR